MEELQAQRKRGGYTWLWILLIIVCIADGMYYYMHYAG
jgi:hypothetical protein